MKRLTTLFPMLCFILSGALCFASGEAGMEMKEDGTPIEVKEKTFHSESDKSASINPSIDGHVLTILFTEDLGEVYAEVTSNTSIVVDATITITPNGILFYIPNTGEYIINITLPNGDEYIGEFEVTD